MMCQRGAQTAPIEQRPQNEKTGTVQLYWLWLARISLRPQVDVDDGLAAY